MKAAKDAPRLDGMNQVTAFEPRANELKLLWRWIL